MRRGSGLAILGIVSSSTPSLNDGLDGVGLHVLRQREAADELAGHALHARIVAVVLALLELARTTQ